MEQIRILPSPRAMEDFFDTAIALVAPDQWNDTAYDIGRDKVLLKIAGKRLQVFMSESLMHIKTKPDDNRENDLIVYAIEEQELQIETPDAPWKWYMADREGYIHGVDVDRFTVNFDQTTQSLRLLDRKRKVALHWMRNLSKVPYWERSFPLREILNWWYRDTPMQPIHSAAVGAGNSGVLIGARGGSGKSSTALSCLLAGMQFAGDDFVLVDTDTLQAYSLYNIAKLEPHAFVRFPQLKPPPETPMIDLNKYQISLARVIPGGLQRTLNLKMILIPQITNGPATYLSPIEKSEVSSALMLSTFYLLKGDTRSVFGKITRLVDALPSQRLNLGLDFERIPQIINNALHQE